MILVAQGEQVLVDLALYDLLLVYCAGLRYFHDLAGRLSHPRQAVLDVFAGSVALMIQGWMIYWCLPCQQLAAAVVAALRRQRTRCFCLGVLFHGRTAFVRLTGQELSDSLRHNRLYDLLYDLRDVYHQQQRYLL